MATAKTKTKNKVRSKTKSDGSRTHELIRLYITTKVHGPDCDEKDKTHDLLERANKEKNLYQFKNDIYFCCYRTTYESDPAVLLIFSITITGLLNGSGASDQIMKIVEMLEDILTPIDDFEFDRHVAKDGSNHGFLRVTKKIREDDFV